LGRDWLRERLISDGFTASGELANHVLIDLKTVSEMRRVLEGLRRLGVYVKGEYPAPLESHLLVTCGPMEMMLQFYDRFCEVTQGAKVGAE